MTKRRITEFLERLSVYDFECSLSELREYVDGLIEKYGEDAAIEITTDYENQYVFDLDRSRLETDEEYQKRLDAEEKQQAKFKINERKEYERLRKKFEKENK